MAAPQTGDASALDAPDPPPVPEVAAPQTGDASALDAPDPAPVSEVSLNGASAPGADGDTPGRRAAGEPTEPSEPSGTPPGEAAG